MLKFLKFIPVQLLFFLVLGIFTGTCFFVNPLYLWVLLTVVIAVLGLYYTQTHKSWYSPFIFTVLVFLATFFIGFSTVTYQNQLHKKKHYTKWLDISITATVINISSA